ncbi:AAA family ATPase [Lutimonas vermicola]|uniref:AAA family ATPase n=1 Tax=Lutimonas vermicola TaxID=414288 RepID=A0ABU9KXI8_9FLAO
MGKKYPFKFLDSYTKEDKDFFFGRKTEIDALYKMIFKTRILVVYGTSGTGKTSLIQCGLANKFNSYDWLSLNIRRGTNIVSALDKSLCSESDGMFSYDDKNKDGIKDLSAKIEAVYKASFRPIYLIFDQFEELYVLGSKSEQKQFIKAIKEILSIKRPVKIILSIREEYLGYLYEFEKEVPQLLRRKLRVEPMNIDKVREVMHGINSYKDSLVRIKDDEIEEITEEIFEKLKGKEKTLTIQLPYLQVFLDKLYMNKTGDEKHETDAEISMDDLKKIGDIDDVLKDFLEEQVKQISGKFSTKKNKVTSEMVWSILSNFCTLEGTKEPISKIELINRLPNVNKKLIDASVEAFTKSRIIKKSDEEDLYELAHDSLALRITEKRSEDDISLLEVKRLIKSKASLKGDFKEFFTAKQLLFIEPYEKKLGSDLSPDEEQLLKDSKKEILKIKKKLKQKERNKRRLIFGVLGVIIIGLLIGGYFLQREFKMKEILNDKLVLKGIIESTGLKLKDATNLKATDPTKALLLDGTTMYNFSKMENEDLYQDLKNGSYGWSTNILFLNKYIKGQFEEIDSLRQNALDSIQKHGEGLLKENHALYKILDFESTPSDRTNNHAKDYTLSGPQALNMIFTDDEEDAAFRIWSGDEAIVRKINNRNDSILQIVFPLDTSEAMVLYNNGRAEYIGNNKAYKPLNIDVLNSRYNSRPLRINSIAPINYEIIGYKMLSALNNDKIVQWNLNGTIRHNDSLKIQPVIYDKGNIQLGDSVVSIAISPRRHKIFTATDNGIGIIWFADTSRVLLPKESKLAFSLEQDTIMSSSFSKDGTLIVTGSKDHSIAIWNDKGKLIKKLKGHTRTVTSVAFSANKKFVYSGSLDGTYRKWLLPPEILKDTIVYKSIKWHNYSTFPEIYDIKAYEKINYYNFPKTLP